MTQVVALSGWKRSGKDTVAAFLSTYGFKRVSFADALKDLVSQQYNVPRESLDHPNLKEQPITHLPVIPTDPFTVAIQQRLVNELSSGFWTPRALCILEGSVKRSVHSNYWVQKVIGDILTAGPEDKYVITDMRYKSEADVLRALIPDIQMWRINRFLDIETKDPSERDLDDYTRFDRVIPNMGTLSDLDITVNSILGHVNLHRIGGI